MKTELDTLLMDGRAEFPVDDGAGEGWCLTATGDYAILPQTAAYIKQHGMEAIAGAMNDLIAADVSITNLEVGLAAPDQLSGKGVRGDRDLFLDVHESSPFSVYSLANNHVLDAGADALMETFRQFDERGIAYVGAGRNQEEAERPLYLDCKGVKVGILAFAQEENQIAGVDAPGTAELVADRVLAAAQRLVTHCDVPVVILHEGFEFMDVPRASFMALCRRLADVGIKLVLGHHPHVPQGIEKRGNALIFYSLGNFLFDQAHFAPYPWARRSFVPEITFRGTEIAAVSLRSLEIEIDDTGLWLRRSSESELGTQLAHLKQISEVLHDEAGLLARRRHFFETVILPEFFGYIQRFGNQHDADFSALIEQFKGQKPVHNLFADFLNLWGERGKWQVG